MQDISNIFKYFPDPVPTQLKQKQMDYNICVCYHENLTKDRVNNRCLNILCLLSNLFPMIYSFWIFLNHYNWIFDRVPSEIKIFDQIRLEILSHNQKAY